MTLGRTDSSRFSIPYEYFMTRNNKHLVPEIGLLVFIYFTLPPRGLLGLLHSFPRLSS